MAAPATPLQIHPIQLFRMRPPPAIQFANGRHDGGTLPSLLAKRHNPTMPLRSIALAVLTLALAASARAEFLAFKLTTPRGAVVSVLADWPDPERFGPGPYPTLVLASGAGYHQRMPLQVAMAETLSAAGVGVLRFDWAYFSAQGQPSDDLAPEREDLQTVLAHARSLKHVDADRLSVAGKSLGSVVAWQVFRADPGLQRAVMLTPLCSRSVDGTVVSVAGERYPEAVGVDARPVLWVLGDRDPACAPALLEAFLQARPQDAVLRLEGDHGLERRDLPPPEAQALRQRVHGQAAQGVLKFTAADAQLP